MEPWLAATDPPTLALLLGAGLIAGLIDAVAGGGGLIALPALLTAGLPPHLALGTNKLAGTFGTLSASRAYVRKGIFRPRLWRAAILATFTGALLGTLAVWLIEPDLLRKAIPLVVLGSAVYVVFKPNSSGTGRPPADPPRKGPGAVLGATLGFYDGFLGPGTGAFWTAATMALFRLDILHASGVARFMNFVSNLVSLLTFAALGLVDYRTGLLMGGALMTGAWIGAHTAIRYGAPLIRPVFVVVVLTLAGRLIWLQWVG